jgi:hypothetical protein
MSQRTTINTFLERARKIHGDKYDYSKVDYKGVNKQVIIICPVHGEFDLRPKAHYDDKRGCPRCDNSGKSGFSDTSTWSDRSKTLYLIEVVEQGERFLKFGVTAEKELKKRFQKGQFPYNYHILFEKRMEDGRKANELEDKLKSKYPKIAYKPSLSFRGDTECLDYGIKEHIMKDLKRLIM